MPNTDRKLRVFLCHASQDKPVVRELYHLLLAEGWVDPWLDEEKLLPGQNWDIEIEKAVESADVVIVCLSNRSVTKEGYIQRELKFVLDIALEKPEGTIFIIPLRLDDCDLPRRLRSWQYVDYFPADRRQWSYQRLLQSLKLRFDQSQPREVVVEKVPPPAPTASHDVEEKITPAIPKTDLLTVALPTASTGILDLGWSILPILYFALIGLYGFGYQDSDFSLFLGIAGILTASVVAIKRQVIISQWIKYSTIAYIAAQSLLIYSDYTGWEISWIIWIVIGVTALITGGLRAMNFQSQRRMETYSTVFFAAFLGLFGFKLVINFFNLYTSEIQTPIIVLGIVASIFAWFER